VSKLNLGSPPRNNEDALELSLSRLCKALAMDAEGREREWAERVGQALADVEPALRQHRAVAKPPDGLFGEVDQTRPTLARQADDLRSAHDDFLLQLVTLHERVRQAAEAFYLAHAAADTGSGRSTDIDVIREQTQQFVASLQENKQAEAKLIMESINTDIGVGD
jgi:hypothetical protein